jgi:putative FmdB family regulatory protein
MPLYEYKCAQCGHEFEALQKAKDKPLERCPNCGGPLRKLISSPAIQFKGKGWYITDYPKKSSPSSETGSETKSADAPDSAKDTKEKKPAAKPATPSKD